MSYARKRKSCEVGGQHEKSETERGSSVGLLTHPALRNMLCLNLVPHFQVATGKTPLLQALLRKKQDPNRFSAVLRNG